MVNTLRNWFYFLAGIVFFSLSKVRFILRGYSPKSTPISEYQSCVDYDLHVVDRWIAHLQEYTGEKDPGILAGRSVLELGPGSDLGAGLYILSRSAREYNAVDVYNLVGTVPGRFYDVFFDTLRAKGYADTGTLEGELMKTRQGKGDRLNYVWRPDFDIAGALDGRRVDIVFSNAAFEHFDDIDATIKAVSKVAVPGARLVALVDLKTHSRWIREKDPNNIYRYPGWLYRLFRFRGTPNRVRPYQYKEAFEKNGWEDVRITTENILDGERLRSVKASLNKAFTGDRNQMDYLTIWICATRSRN